MSRSRPDTIGMKTLISIVIPLYNERENIPVIYERVQQALAGHPHEMIFVNDGSTDGSDEVLRDLAKNDKTVKYIEFSRNFSKEAATSAGIHHAKGDAIVMIDADLQHPPELLPEFIARLREGAEMVIGVRALDRHEGMIKRLGSKLFYTIINAVGDTMFVPRSTDFRLIDRRVADEFNRCVERNRMTRGILDWLGFKKEYITFTVADRSRGVPSYSKRKLFGLALFTIVSHSTFPLRLIGYLGAFIIALSGLLGLFIIVEDVLLQDPLGLNISGTAMIATLILFLVGVMISWLGLLASYTLNIQREVVGRPLYVIRESKNVT